MARKWIKVWVQESLTGTIRFDFTPAERGVWFDLLILAGNCRLDGIIAAGPGKPYPHSWIAGTLNIPLELLEQTLKKCNGDRTGEDGDGIHIKNWTKYQSEYERQKPYREQKKISDDPDKYKKGKYGHMVVSTKEDLKKLEAERGKVTRGKK